MGHSISHDLISLVSHNIHHYETRYALRLTCKKFAQNIHIFDPRAFPIFAKRGFSDRLYGDEVIWKGHYTHVVPCGYARTSQTIQFRPCMRYYLLDSIRPRPHFGFQDPRAVFIKWSSTMASRSKYSGQRCILWRFLEALSLQTRAYIYSAVAGSTFPDWIQNYVTIKRFDERGDHMEHTPEIWMHMEDYQAAMQEMEQVARMADAEGICFHHGTCEDTLLEEYHRLKRLKMK